MVGEKDTVFDMLMNQRVKIKYTDEGKIRSISGTVKGANNFYVVLERPMGDPLFVNHSVISRIIPIDDFDIDADGYNRKSGRNDGVT